MRFREAVLHIIVFIVILFSGFSLFSSAGNGADIPESNFLGNPNVSLTPDKTAFTIGLDDKSDEMHDISYLNRIRNIHGITGPAELSEGQHYYEGVVSGLVTVGYWKLEHWTSKCIHSWNNYDFNKRGYDRMGVTVTNCYRSYPPGWTPYCAVCGEKIEDLFFYMTERVAATIGYIPSNTGYSTYFYLCPYDRSLENERRIEHICTCISANRYGIRYNKISDESGSMGTDRFYYDLATKYEGMEVTPQKKLSLCSFTRPGYVFKGWALEKDGEVVFSDGEKWEKVQEKIKAKELENDSVIDLYAVWEQMNSSLKLTFTGGTVGNIKDSLSYNKAYGTGMDIPVPVYSSYYLTLDAAGGSVEGKSSVKKYAERVFREWKLPSKLYGKTDGKKYIFTSQVPGSKDVLTAVTGVSPICLPTPVRSGYRFTGWYNSRGIAVGGSDGYYTPGSNETLSAGWERVTLSLSAVSDYSSGVNGGKGAVDLSWKATGAGYDSAYRIYKSEDGVNYEVLSENGVVSGSNTISRDFAYNGAYEQSYSVSETGIYSVVLSGAEGGGFGSKSGGLGGRIYLRLWLIKGQTVSVTCGQKGGGIENRQVYASDLSGSLGGGYGGGGAGHGGGAGGGGTFLYITDTRGNKYLVAAAGGGGGAGISENGGAGGSSGRCGAYGSVSDGEACRSYSENGMSYTQYSSGGGGGYYPGTPGKTVYKKHVHSVDNPACRYHRHTGNKTDGGGCYTVADYKYEDTECPIVCFFTGTSTYICQNPGCGNEGVLNDYSEYGYYYGGCWHYTGFVGYPVCPKCGDNNGIPLSEGELSGIHEESKLVATYSLGCGLKEGFNCRESQTSETLESSLSYAGGGGGNWVDRYSVREFVVIDANTDSAECVGVNGGNGSASLSITVSGCRYDERFDDVPAPDKAAPGEITEGKVTKNEGKSVTVTWKAAGDNGSIYYFKADNYSLKTGNVAVTSNIEKKVMTTGVKGYYVKADSSKSTAVNSGNGSFVSKCSYDTGVSPGKTTYVHVAAVDKAGNVGPTTHIKIDPDNESIDICWDIFTEKLKMTEGDNVYSAGGSKYYIRADGTTPFYIRYGAYMDGKARESYQIGKCFFRDEDKTDEYSCILVQNAVPIKDGNVDVGNISYSDKPLMIKRYSGTECTRSDRCGKILISQGFTAGAELDGKSLSVIPGAEAVSTAGIGESVSSSLSNDKKNGLVLLFDAMGPAIEGVEEFDPGKLFIDGSEETRSVTVRASDSGSGLNAGKSYIRIFNRDNACENIWYFSEGTKGKVTLSFDRDEMEELFFFGVFCVEIHAVDNVGNVTDEKFDGVGFDLDTDVVRLLSELDGKTVFARGESGDLYITSTGYVDRVEVEFPDELSEYNTVYDYTSDPEFEKNEVLRFMIPLYGIPEEDWDFMIKVTAHKGEEELESHPRVSVVNVSGSVLDELKTGLE